MSNYEQLKWAVGHDPCREGDRSPAGAVVFGQSVQVKLRVAASALSLVESVELLVAKAGAEPEFEWDAVSLSPCDGGFEGAIEPASYPHVEFYAFRLGLPDEAQLYYVPRADGAATAGELVRDSVDGEWTEAGWAYYPERLAARPAVGFGLPEITPGFQITVYEPAFETPDWLAGAVMYQIFPDRFARGEGGVRSEGVAYHERMGRPVHLHERWDEPLVMTEPLEDVEPSEEIGEIEAADNASGSKSVVYPEAETSGEAVPEDVFEAAESEPVESDSVDDAASIEQGASLQLPAYDPVEFYGGTLAGIREKLPYLASLGVEVLYLNPVFEARSNHRYDTADYEHIDPLLGSDEDFSALASDAREYGISIVLDAVLSHTGNDSRYFNAHATYAEPGAAQGEESPYHSWYDFADDGTYRCWWGDPSLPEVDERSASWQRYILGVDEWGNPDGTGVLAKWLAAGARGYRLDVADEIPDDVLARLRASVKRANPEAAIIGEVWEDATTKVSYGERRTYALGHALDSVMNYPLRSALLGFATGAIDARQLAAFLKLQQANNPAPLYRCLMNLLSSHDVERMRSALATGVSLRQVPRAQQVELIASIGVDDEARAACLQRMVAGLLYALPGVPCIYYGDERGLQGGSDPFCRATFPWDDGEERALRDIGVDDASAYPYRADVGEGLTAFYQALGMLRKDSHVLRDGEMACVAPDPEVACIVRMLPDGEAAIAVANRAPDAKRIAFDLRTIGVSPIEVIRFELAPLGGSLASIRIEDDLVTIDAPACQTSFFTTSHN